MPATSQLRERAQAWWGLTTKAVDQWLDAPPGRQARPAFVLGCQRSGTTMLIDVLRRSPSILVWPEKSEIPYHDYRLRSPATVELVNRLTPAEVGAFWQKMLWPPATRAGVQCVGDDESVFCQVPPAQRQQIDWLAGQHSDYFFYSEMGGVMEIQRLGPP